MQDLSHFSILIFLAFFLRSTWWQFLTEAKHQNCTGQNSAILRFSCTAPSSVGCPFQPLLWVLSQVSQKDVCTCPRQSSISGCKKYLTENYTNRYLSAIVFSNVTPRETRPTASLTALSHVSLEDRKDRSRVFQCITLEVLIHYAKLRTNYFVPMPSVQDYGTDTSPCAWPEGQHLCMSSAAYICHIPSSCLHAAWARATGSV